MKWSMIERVAKAIDDQMASDDNAPENIARAAIAAMRDPSPEMIAAGREALLADRHRFIGSKQPRLSEDLESAIMEIDLSVAFRPMIDECLK